jgi:hypothetical protein
MKKCGTKITVMPCSADGGQINSLEDVGYFLMDCEPVYLLGEDRIEGVSNTLLHFDDIVRKDIIAKEKCLKFYEEHIAIHENDPDWKPEESDDFDYYSDWHKELFGFRPRGFVFGVNIDPQTGEEKCVFNEELHNHMKQVYCTLPAEPIK